MSLPWSAELCEVIEEARLSTRQAGVLMTTATVLRAMLVVSSDARLFLRNEGIEENLLAAVARRTHPEHGDVLDRVLIRATQMAASATQPEVEAAHVLHAMTLESRCEAAEALLLLGLDLDVVRNATLRVTGAQMASVGRARGGRRRESTTHHSLPGTTTHTRPPLAAAPPAPPESRPSSCPDRRQIAFHPALAELLESAHGLELDTLDDDDHTPDTYELLSGELPSDYGRREAWDAVHDLWDEPSGVRESLHVERPQTWSAGAWSRHDEGESGAFPVLGHGGYLPGMDSGIESVPDAAAWHGAAAGGAPLLAPPGGGWSQPAAAYDPWLTEWPQTPQTAGLDGRASAPEPASEPWPQSGWEPPVPSARRERQQPPTGELSVRPRSELLTPLGMPRLDLDRLRKPTRPRATPASPEPKPAPDTAAQASPDAGTDTTRPPTSGSKKRSGASTKSSEGKGRGNKRRSARRQRTARESQEETARSLAARLFGNTDESPSVPTPPTEPAAPPTLTPAPVLDLDVADKPVEQPRRRPELAATIRRGTRHDEPSRSRSPIIRAPQRKRGEGFDRFELDPKVFPTLARFGRNLLAEAREGNLDPVIGREDEIEQLIDIVNKRRSNNPVLVGPAGVGKTAIVEGLARQMAREQPPAGLRDRTIVALDIGTLLCGTGLRGAFQERLIGIKKEVRKARGRIIVFLDELHTWLGAGGGDAGSDASGELKIALARGELPCIGATTEDEFKRHVEADPAFERRFEIIDVRPPSVEDSITIITGIINRYADHHEVSFDDDAVESAVKLSDRYIRERTLPDKAIGILDRAGSAARRQGSTRVGREHIAHVVANLANIAPERLLMEDRQRFLEMEGHVCEQLVGHDELVERIARVIRRNYAGFASNRPIGSFLFLGPTGVGKTETVKVLAEFLFGSRDAIVRFDMSEFMEQHAVARLLGAPPGYVGFDEGGQLTEAVRRHPYQIVLLDEIEKAHPDVLNILLQLLDEGRLTDGRGRTVDFSNTVVVMTSNLGASALSDSQRSTIGFGNPAPSSAGDARRARAEDAVIDAARGAFPPELWNRIEERLVFHALTRTDVAHIAALQLRDSARRLAHERDIQLSWDEALVEHLIDNGGFDPRYGARPMRKTIQRLVEAPVAEAILRSTLVTGDHGHVYVECGLVLVERRSPLSAPTAL